MIGSVMYFIGLNTWFLIGARFVAGTLYDFTHETHPYTIYRCKIDYIRKLQILCMKIERIDSCLIIHDMYCYIGK